jgi:signal transduction histidine kinase
MEPGTTTELRKVIALSDLPEEHLQWILDRSEVHEFDDGTLIFDYGAPADYMFINIEGEVSFYMNVNGTKVYYYTFGNDTTTGGIGGLLPYSRMKTSPGYAYAKGKVRMMRLHKQHFHDLEQLNPDFIQRCVGYMTERARTFATNQLQHEKVNALGQLAAGIAHELNNPASAINRIASELSDRMKATYEHTEQLLRHGINPEHIQLIRTLVETKEKELKDRPRMSTMQRMAKEDEIADWLDENKYPVNGGLSETFAEFGFSGVELGELQQKIGKETLPAVLQWIDNLLNSRRILKDLNDASCRISNLVGAIKSHVHMDRTNDMQPTRINKDIDNTLTLLGHKLREKNITVTKHYGADLPEVPAYVGELNQVWTNLIDNAIFALGQEGELTIESKIDKKNLKVSIIDNGPGIPKEIQSRIFDPFFTTKKVGEGTGIGLDLVTRIIKRHNGEIKLNSVPGRTEFTVCLPLDQTQTSPSTPQ